MPQPPTLNPIAAAPLSVVLLPGGRATDAMACVQGWLDYLSSQYRPWQLVVVDPGWLDLKQVAEQTNQYPGLQILRQEGPPGEGAALRLALPFVEHPLVAYTLLDARFRPCDLNQLLLKRLESDKPEAEIDHVHLMNTYRAGRRMPLPLRLVGLLWRILCRVLFNYTPRRSSGYLGWRAHVGRAVIRALFGVRYHDVGSPFRLLRREVFERMVLQSDGPFVHVEILAKANFLGHVMGEEVPLKEHPPVKEYRPGGSLRQRVREFWQVLTQPQFVVLEPSQPAPASDRRQPKELPADVAATPPELG